MRDFVILIYCDGCNAEDVPEGELPLQTAAVGTITLIVAGKPKTLDLCERHLKPLAALHESHGLAPEKQPRQRRAPKQDPIPEAARPVQLALQSQTLNREGKYFCPICLGSRDSFKDRKNAMSHMRSSHKMTLVAASRAVPPIGDSVECATCDGMLLPVHPGTLAKHINLYHPGVPVRV